MYTEVGFSPEGIVLSLHLLSAPGHRSEERKMRQKRKNEERKIHIKVSTGNIPPLPPNLLENHSQDLCQDTNSRPSHLGDCTPGAFLTSFVSLSFPATATAQSYELCIKKPACHEETCLSVVPSGLWNRLAYTS